VCNGHSGWGPCLHIHVESIPNTFTERVPFVPVPTRCLEVPFTRLGRPSLLSPWSPPPTPAPIFFLFLPSSPPFLPPLLRLHEPLQTDFTVFSRWSSVSFANTSESWLLSTFSPTPEEDPTITHPNSQSGLHSCLSGPRQFRSSLPPFC